MGANNLFFLKGEKKRSNHLNCCAVLLKERPPSISLLKLFSEPLTAQCISVNITWLDVLVQSRHPPEQRVPTLSLSDLHLPYKKRSTLFNPPFRDPRCPILALLFKQAFID